MEQWRSRKFCKGGAHQQKKMSNYGHSFLVLYPPSDISSSWGVPVPLGHPPGYAPCYGMDTYGLSEHR